jgi:3-oxoacyl-[acyl-carrier protein] reductase
MTLNGKTALVTGASRGIGKAIANDLANNGAFVIGTATSETGASGISENLGEQGVGKVLNLESSDSIEQLFADIKRNFEAPLILVNNAGITRDNIALRMKDDEWTDVIETNLNSVYRVSKACLRGMTKARWGRIINISSVVGNMGNPGQSNYAAAKAGMQGYSRSLASELGSRGITVNCVAPGFIATDVPVGRLGEVHEVAALVSFLASESAGYISGETSHINGAMYMA